MTEPNLDKILRRIAYWNGYDSAGEWERTGHEVKAQLKEYIATQKQELLDSIEKELPKEHEVSKTSAKNLTEFINDMEAIGYNKALDQVKSIIITKREEI